MKTMAKQKLETDGEDQTELTEQSVQMYTETPDHPGGPTEADVHPDEVENWKAQGWRVKE